MLSDKFWIPIVGESWFLNNRELFESPQMGQLMNFLGGQYKTATIAPKQGSIFKAFKKTSFQDTRVIIIGAEPYSAIINDEPEATGLAFASPELSSINPVLNGIKNALEDNMDILKLDFDVTLEDWAKQGVLLLNTSLTINVHRKTFHKPFWEFFVVQIIRKLNEEKQGLHFVFWGKEAQRFNIVNGIFHYIYKEEYPKRNWKCNHFEQINNNITMSNGEEDIITW